MMGEVSFCQVAIFFSLIGLCSTLIFWPLALALALSGAGTLQLVISLETYSFILLGRNP